jgi:aspartate/methionine/tyrosine aminotransferase
MRYRRLPIEAESPEQAGYDRIACNLAESSISDRFLRDLPLDLGATLGLALGYGDHAGRRALRELIAEQGGPGLAPDHVIVTPGAAAALYIVATALLDRGERAVIEAPNYATNLETPRALGADVATLDLRFEEGFRLDLRRLDALVTPGTRLVSLTTPHNPTGRVLPPEDLARAAAVAASRGARLLVDETYRDLALGGPPGPLAAALHPGAVSVASISKAYGVPGIRVGWIVCRDERLLEIFLAAKEQIFICTSAVDEEIAYRVLLHREAWLARARAHLEGGLAATRAWLRAERRVECIDPEGGAVCFPRIRREVALDLDCFHATLAGKYGTWVGPGHWFDVDRRHMRIGFGWPRPEELARGLANISLALDEAARAG